MLNSLQLCNVNHVRRETNGIADRPGNGVLSLLDEQVYMEEASQCILDIVNAEHSNI
jgi:hypothetical protein